MRLTCVAFALIAALSFVAPLAVAAEPPVIGDPAPGFDLRTIDGQSISLGALTTDSNLVLVVMRGWTGYQCPLSAGQMAKFAKQATAFAKAGAKVVFVYPASAEQIDARMADFMQGRTLPDNFLLAADPDFALTTAYGLRWQAPFETAYPATFVIDRQSVVRYAKVSQGHGGRATAAEVLEALGKLQ
ncbi:MAG: peroxiredoxin family protein [Pirellulales bacterium]|nr:peroxiredoxin family protein [Pirellulales bacterium]